MRLCASLLVVLVSSVPWVRASAIGGITCDGSITASSGCASDVNPAFGFHSKESEDTPSARAVPFADDNGNPRVVSGEQVEARRRRIAATGRLVAWTRSGARIALAGGYGEGAAADLIMEGSEDSDLPHQRARAAGNVAPAVAAVPVPENPDVDAAAMVTFVHMLRQASEARLGDFDFIVLDGPVALELPSGEQAAVAVYDLFVDQLRKSLAPNLDVHAPTQVNRVPTSHIDDDAVVVLPPAAAFATRITLIHQQKHLGVPQWPFIAHARHLIGHPIGPVAAGEIAVVASAQLLSRGTSDRGRYQHRDNSAFAAGTAEALEAKWAGNQGLLENSERQVYRLLPDVLAAIVPFIPKTSPVILELGCGTGFITQALLTTLPTAHVVATDVSPGFVEVTRRRLQGAGVDGTRYDVVLTGQEELALVRPGSADVAIVCDVYHHLEAPLTMMTEVLRVLRPGGRLVLIESHKHGHTQDHTHGEETAKLRHRHRSKQDYIGEIMSAGFSAPEAADVEGLTDNYVLVFTRS
jgi:SAM-dependent methyltransferase